MCVCLDPLILVIYQFQRVAIAIDMDLYQPYWYLLLLLPLLLLFVLLLLLVAAAVVFSSSSSSSTQCCTSCDSDNSRICYFYCYCWVRVIWLLTENTALDIVSYQFYSYRKPGAQNVSFFTKKIVSLTNLVHVVSFSCYISYATILAKNYCCPTYFCVFLHKNRYIWTSSTLCKL